MPVPHESVTVTRTLAAPPDRVYAAFADPDLRRRWFQLGSVSHELDFRIGGGERAADHIGSEHVEYASSFLDLVSDERIVFCYVLLLDGVRRIVSLVTIELTPDGAGTHIDYTEQYVILRPVWGDAGHLEGGIRLLLNGLMAVLDGRPV
jgi:uncharacterized protein YndB with AHSA1/START domain